jgi:hypothetical protein
MKNLAALVVYRCIQLVIWSFVAAFVAGLYIAARDAQADSDREFKRLWDLLMVASGQSIYSIAINSPSLNEEDKSVLKETKKRGQ